MKFNEKSSGTRTINRAGGKAYSQTPELELVSLLLTSFVSDKFYESANSQLERLSTLATDIKDKKFLAQAAIYARTEFGMRSITHALAVNIVNLVKGEEWTKRAIDKIIYRPDDALEIVAYYLKKYGKPVPNSLKKGINLGLKKFDAYQLAKYRGEKKAVKMIDIFNLVHPKPDKEAKETYKKLIDGELKSKNTWESKVSASGKSENKVEAKKEAWKELLVSHKLGYFALLRNLRNLLQELGDDAEMIDEVVKQLTDRNAIKKSLLFPFRFNTAIQELRSESGSQKILSALDTAMEISLDNVPELPGRNLIVVDESGSMGGRPAEIGALFAAVLLKTNPSADFITFATSGRYQNINPKSCVSDIVNSMKFNGGGTNFSSIFEAANKPYDRIVILSDMQGWVEDSWSGRPLKGAYKNYCTKYNVTPHLYSFDLQGYGDMKFPENQVYCIAGFSDKIFDVIKVLEEDKNALVNKIKEIKI